MYGRKKPWQPTKPKLLLTIVYGHQWNGSGKLAKRFKEISYIIWVNLVGCSSYSTV
jgi:hypothetical protein